MGKAPRFFITFGILELLAGTGYAIWLKIYPETPPNIPPYAREMTTHQKYMAVLFVIGGISLILGILMKVFDKAIDAADDINEYMKNEGWQTIKEAQKKSKDPLGIRKK